MSRALRYMRKVLKGPLPKRPKMPAGKAPGEPEKKRERLQRLVAEENWNEALRVAAGAVTTEPDRTTLQRAWQAIQQPGFTRELHRDPDTLVEAGKKALRRLFGRKKT